MNTSIISTPDLIDIISNTTVVIDTCVIIDAIKNEKLDTLLREFLKKDCTFLSAQPIKNEFLVAADSVQKYDELNEYLKSLQLVFLPLDIESRLNKEGAKLHIALRRSKVKNPSFVDRLVLSIPFLYRTSPEKIYILTSNHKDIPLEFYDRVGFISIDKGVEFAEIGLYQFNGKKFDKMVANV